MSFRSEDMANFVHEQKEYWRRVNESEGFDVNGIKIPKNVPGLLSYNCQHEFYRYRVPVLVKRYAMLGLHRYNMSKGTNLTLHHIEKYNSSAGCLQSYYITLAACDPTTNTLVTFEVGVNEHEYGSLNLSCSKSRPKGTREEHLPHQCGRAVADKLPYWPSDFNDGKRFYVVKESEIRDNDWIRLYLELALCTNDRRIPNKYLSKLEILKVAIETVEEDVEPPNKRLEAKNATLYITFKGLELARVGEIGEHVERRVIVRRVVDERTGHLNLLGGFGFLIGEEAEKQRPMSSFDVDHMDVDDDDEQQRIHRPPLTMSALRKLLLGEGS